MSKANRRRRRINSDNADVDTLEQRLLLTGIDCCADDQVVSSQSVEASAAQSDQSGPAANSVLPNNSGSRTGRITRNNRHDWFQLNLTETTNVTLNLTELTGNLRLRLYDADGRIAGSNNRGRADELIQEELSAGNYRVRVSGVRRANRGPTTGSYRLSWNLEPALPPDGAGNSLGAARNLGTVGSATAEDYVGPEDQVDVYRFTINERSRLDLSLGDLSADADLQLLNSRGQRLANSNRSGSADERISGQIEPGTYYAAVTPWQTAATTYTFTVDASPLGQAPEVPVDDGGTDAFPDVPDLRGFNNWHLNAVNAPEVWAQGYTGDDVLVAVVDTGVDLDHPDLVSNIYVNPGEIVGNGIDDDGNGFVDDINGWDFTTNTNDSNDINGHGTHVAGIIAAASNGFGATGVAYDATILPVQVLGDNGSGSNRSVANGIRYAVDVGADIINLSLGGGFSSVIRSAIRYAELNDVLVVAASGNDSAATPGYPARFSGEFSNTLSVGAFDSNERLAGFSNRVGNSGAVQVDAPGVSIYSTYPDRYARLSGTSMAAPNAAAVAALALSADPDLSAAQLRTLIVNGAQESIVNSDSIGRVNAASTVALAAAGLTGSGARSSGRSSGSESRRSRTQTDPGVTSYRAPTQSVEDLFEEQDIAVRSFDLAAASNRNSTSLATEDTTANENSEASDDTGLARSIITEAQTPQSQYSALDSLFAQLDQFSDV